MVAGISMVLGVFRSLMCKCFVKMLMETVEANSSTEDPWIPQTLMVTSVIRGRPACCCDSRGGERA